MLTRTVRLQILAFVVIAILGITYVAVRYVGIGQWLGTSGYTVKMNLPQGGGIFTNAEVTYRGVSVGRVGDMRLTRNGIQIDLDITSDDKIPSDVKAVVANRSVIGEQYVDLRPQRNKGPYLSDSSTIAQKDTSLPPPVEDLLMSTDRFAQSVPEGSLRVVVNELYDATRNAGQNLQSLLTTTRSFFTTADEALPQTIDLITTSKTVLATQQQTSASIKQFSANLSRIGAQLRDSNGDISKLLKVTRPALTEANGLINDIQGTFKGLLANLLTTSRVFLTNKSGLREILVKLPQAITAGGSVVTSKGVNVGLVPTFFDPLPCTDGYGGTDVRPASNTKGNPALNTNASCKAPPSAGNVRGAQNAPGSK